MLDCDLSIANALEIPQSYTEAIKMIEHTNAVNAANGFSRIDEFVISRPMDSGSIGRHATKGILDRSPSEI